MLEFKVYKKEREKKSKREREKTREVFRMSKIKIGFSLLFAILLVGMLSTAAFAKSPFGFEAVQVGNSLKVDFKGLSTDTAGTVFTVTLKDSKSVKETKDITTDNNKAGSYTYTPLTVGERYTVELAYQTAPTIVVASSSVIVADNQNKVGSEVTVDHDTNLINANETGFEGLSKKRNGQKMHGAYQNNTNSCASCHQTHTGEDHYLLFRDGTYSTCAACHDGTMGANNVFGDPTNAGTFGGTHDGNMSIHLSDGTVGIKAAPGGNHTDSGKWGEEFTCASCHNPHGSDSARLLKADPAGWIKTENTISADGKTNGGMKFSNRSIYDKSSLPTTNVGDYILVRQTLANQAAVDANVFFKNAGVPVGSTVISTFKWDYKGKYIEGSSLWLRSDNGRPAVTTSLKVDNTDKPATANFVFVWKDGFAYSKPGDTTAASINKATFLIGASIEKVTFNSDYFDSTSASYVKDSGVQMSKFCASCHTDYLSATYSNETGVFTTAHRHQSNTDKLTCVRCHYAHGTDAKIMKDSLDRGLTELTATGGLFAGNTTAALDYLKDPNPSSALKRYTGNAVCFGCHDGSIASDEVTWSNYSPNQPGAVTAPAVYGISATNPTVTKSALLTSPTDADFTGKTPVPVKLTVTSAGTSYSGKVRIAAPNVAGIQLWAKDSAGNWYNINQTGWGPVTGFTIDLNAVTNVYVVADTTLGTSVNVLLKVVDATDATKVIATKTITATLK
jgi:predicted CXXCH cytochrome family protein